MGTTGTAATGVTGMSGTAIMNGVAIAGTGMIVVRIAPGTNAKRMNMVTAMVAATVTLIAGLDPEAIINLQKGAFALLFKARILQACNRSQQ